MEELLIYLFSYKTLIIVFLGTLGGVLIGVLPGLSGPNGVALLLPFTFAMEPVSGLLLLGGIYMGSSYGGSVSAILLNAPGTSYAAATALEGYPLCKLGRAKEGLYFSLAASVVGGVIGVSALILFAPILANFALKFGPPEMFLLATAGLAIIGVVAGENLIKGFAAGAIGVLISTVGPDLMTGVDRLTFGSRQLEAGIPLVPVLVGLFGISEMFTQAIYQRSESLERVKMMSMTVWNVTKRLFTDNWLVLTKSSLLGTIIGIMPGAGAAVASFIAYGEAKRSSDRPERFGKGSVEGLVAAESANNASVGGALVPLLALGVPGSCTTAILYGALTIHGLIPGPMLFVNTPEIVYGFMSGMLLTVLFTGVIGIVGANHFPKVMRVKFKFLVPTILILCCIGAYSIRNSVFDVLIAIVSGICGVLFNWGKIPLAPIVMGIILGPIGEEGLRQTMVITHAQDISIAAYIISRPISITLFLILVAVILSVFRSFRKMDGQQECSTINSNSEE